MHDLHHRIIKTALHTPSADNMQPWLFESKEDSLQIIYLKNRSRQTPLYNIDGFADQVSFGMLAENIHLAARLHGHEATIEYHSPDHTPLATITFTHQPETEPHPHIDTIPKRFTDRRPYDNSPLDAEIRSEVERIAQESGATLYWIEGKKELQEAARALQNIDRLLWTNPLMRDNLLRMLRFGNRDQHSDGLPIDSLGLGWKKPGFILAIKLARFFPFLWHILAFGSAQNTAINISHSSALGLLVLPRDNEKERFHIAFAGGRIFQRLWLAFSHKLLRFQPLFASLDLLENARRSLGGLHPKEERFAKELVSYFHRRFPSIRDGVEIPVALFRVGYPKHPTHEPAPKLQADLLTRK